ncbi:MAG: peptidoglycan DD-metalloendopeptidase family protein [Bacteroidales bacterium]|nr:peptidoglycan DD-metalloendopeptidase family protein [Bacteroidales bacterium]MCF8402706.1 peptidoglycan DD-metalloendopeptidase family protein [Bacteroidales bacterium]
MNKKRVIEIFLLVTAAALIIIYAKTPNPENTTSLTEELIIKPVDHQMEYGIITDSLLVIKDKVKKNQFLADILLNYQVDYKDIDNLAKRSKEVFDVRRIRAGNNYTILCNNDSLPKACYFIYENSPTEYIVFDLRDSLHIHMGKKDIETRLVTTSGLINSSLWNAMVDNHSDPNLANELSEIYAWTIDFFGIQKGDSYKVIYEELYVEGEPIGIGKVHAALFNHADFDYYSFYFVSDSGGDYYDDEANSMRRTFLKAPLKFKRISSRFSYNRLHPVLKKRMPHTGVDYAADVGTPVHSVGDGEVVFARKKGANGNIVKVKHNGTYTTAYLHLSKFGKGIKEGSHVKQGDVIGYVGSTGRSTGPHLDFRFYRNGEPVDPLKVKSPPAKPVDSAYLDQYKLLVKEYQLKLDSIVLPADASFAEVN